jgi:hypothetical protein
MLDGWMLDAGYWDDSDALIQHLASSIRMIS